MPKANALSITQRRCVLTGIMAAPLLAITPAGAAAQLGDAPLFASHQRFQAAYSAVRTMSNQPEPTGNTPEADVCEARFDALVLEECDRLEELAAIPALTPQGQRLKAEIILALLPERLRTSEMDGETQLVLSLARDLVRGNAA
ncbi:hypothetical protein ACI01nite_25230 [Acetobacter cibinongensis]|uniref:Uncharacterized protein n=1 Tax=Acetobacter cibinongensis TaxID=146475 RepID=A0A0D6N6J0_9PROT|nr:hypothetical protein [Acetobacter cibinongensis]GAN61584.1 hypothetical protein Abci_046_017 [Acetobacter cibinongensis]GBQ17672.1 hypothetical protein AA0482_1979 [Acetobacter cibinongensis NRIC 0482]GEL59921.1 hypothetical protein ACI01nite_25230 [Acetobacter cibinongensis]